MFNTWWDNIESERQLAQDQGLDQGLEQLDQLDQRPQERRYPSRNRQLTTKAVALIGH
jgi:hypothetical protein